MLPARAGAAGGLGFRKGLGCRGSGWLVGRWANGSGTRGALGSHALHTARTHRAPSSSSSFAPTPEWAADPHQPVDAAQPGGRLPLRWLHARGVPGPDGVHGVPVAPPVQRLPAGDPDQPRLRGGPRDAPRKGPQPGPAAGLHALPETRGPAARALLQDPGRLQPHGAPDARGAQARRHLLLRRQPRPGRGHVGR